MSFKEAIRDPLTWKVHLIFAFGLGLTSILLYIYIMGPYVKYVSLALGVVGLCFLVIPILRLYQSIKGICSRLQKKDDNGITVTAQNVVFHKQGFSAY